MDAPLSGASQGYDIPNISSFNDPLLDSLLHCFDDYSNSQCSVNDLFNEPIHASSLNQHHESIPLSNTPSDCTLQPRVYNRSPSLILSYTPPPSAKLVELHCLPSQPLAADMSAPVAADVPVPFIMPHPCDMPSHFIHADVASHMSPSHSLHADVLSNVSAPNMPPHCHIGMLPPYPNSNTHQFDACPDVLCSTGSQSHDPYHNFTFSFSDVDAKHKNQHVFHDRSKLTTPMLMNSMNLGLPKLEVPTSPLGCITSGAASPAYMDNSDSAAMELSSASAPAAPATSNSSFYWASTPLERRRTSFSVPPSPTPSVNKKESANEEIGSSPRGISKVAFKVKTKLLNLHDGFTWKKYGEKIIKKDKYPRSYFKCDEKDRCGCEVLKRTQRCTKDEDFVVFTYLGRHNHNP